MSSGELTWGEYGPAGRARSGWWWRLGGWGWEAAPLAYTRVDRRAG